MSECCDTTCQSDSKPRPKTLKKECPVCGSIALDVPERTLLQHIKNVWRYDLIKEQHYFCRTEYCDVVYFSESGTTLFKNDIRTRIGIKEQDDTALLCYCFGVNKINAATDKTAKEFVVKQTKASTCTCDTSNPSGRCCLKDFPKSN